MTSSITDLRAAIGVALEALSPTTSSSPPQEPHVYTRAVGSVDPPCVVIANGDPWVGQADEETGGFGIRVLRHQLLLLLANPLEELPLEQFETWIDELPAVLHATTVAGHRFQSPTIANVSPPRLIQYGKAELAGVIVDIETHQQIC